MQSWFIPVGLYCERIDTSFWGEPINAITNIAFWLAGWMIWRQPHPQARLLGGLIVAVGLGSFLFHTFANALTGLLDVLAIAVYLLTYAWLWPRLTNASPRWVQAASLASLLGAVAFASMLTRIVLVDWPLPPGSYLGAWFYLVIIATLASRQSHAGARWLWLAAVLFVFSMTARQLDMPLCETMGGTHWLWHLLNAAVLYFSAKALLSTPPRT